MSTTKILFVFFFGCLFQAVAEDRPSPSILNELGIMKFEGSEFIRSKQENYIEYKWGEQTLKGKVERFVYKIPEASSELEIADNLALSLSEALFEDVSSSKARGYYIVNHICEKQPYGCMMGKDTGQNFNEGLFVKAKKKETSGDYKYVVSVIAKLDGYKKFIKIPKNDEKESLQLDKGQYVQIIDVITPKLLTRRMVENLDTISAALEKDGKINLYGIFFEFDKAEIKPESEPVLSSVASVLQADPKLKLNVIGHTDNVGLADYNKNLSLRRAQAVVDNLTSSFKIEAGRLVAKGEGAERPVAGNDTDEGRAKNRRVELVKM